MDPPKSDQTAFRTIKKGLQEIAKHYKHTLVFNNDTGLATLTFAEMPEEFKDSACELGCNATGENVCILFDLILKALESYQTISNHCTSITVQALKDSYYDIRLTCISRNEAQNVLNKLMSIFDTKAWYPLNSTLIVPSGYVRINHFLYCSHKLVDPYIDAINELADNYNTFEKDGFLFIKPEQGTWKNMDSEVVQKLNGPLDQNKDAHASNYKIHLMPHMNSLELVIQNIMKNKDITNSIRSFKVSIDQDTFDPETKTHMPRVVLYVKGKTRAAKVIKILNKMLKGLSATPATPRFSTKVNDMIYYAQGNGDHKVLVKNDHYFEQPGKVHFIHTYEKPKNSDKKVYYLKWT
jgi:hypothetical protein